MPVSHRASRRISLVPVIAVIAVISIAGLRDRTKKRCLPRRRTPRTRARAGGPARALPGRFASSLARSTLKRRAVRALATRDGMFVVQSTEFLRPYSPLVPWPRGGVSVWCVSSGTRGRPLGVMRQPSPPFLRTPRFSLRTLRTLRTFLSRKLVVSPSCGGKGDDVARRHASLFPDASCARLFQARRRPLCPTRITALVLLE